MKERPILMSGPMVRAILEDRKTQTRRLMKNPADGASWSSPYGIAGDRLWVRESWFERNGAEDKHGMFNANGVAYRADCASTMIDYLEQSGARARPSIFMPRRACRLVLEVTGVRVERLQDISEDDAKSEGITAPIYPPVTGAARYSLAYRKLWDSLNGKRAPWSSNPWVWVVSFRRIP